MEATPDEPPRPRGLTAIREWVGRIDRIAIVVVLVALVVRIAYWRLAIPDYRPRSDAAHYYDIGRAMANGDGFAHTFPQLHLHPTAFRPPLFPLLLGGLFFVFGASIGLAQLTNLVLGLVAVGLAMVLARELGCGRVGRLAAGLAVALCPPLIYNDVAILTESLSIVLLLGTLILLGRQRWVLGGIGAGLLVLSRTSAQFILVVVVLWLLWQVGWRRALQVGAIAVVVIAPWSIRNAVQVGTASLSTSNGFNLAAMYGPPAIEHRLFIDPVYDDYYDDLRLTQFDEAKWDAELREIGLESLKEHPEAVVRVVRRNITAFFELKPSRNTGAERFDGRNLDVRDALAFLVPVSAVLGTAGLWLARRRALAVLLAGTAVYFLLASIFFVAAPRLRAPIDLAWCIGIGILVEWAVDRRRRTAGTVPA
jgi:hypothetical protein